MLTFKNLPWVSLTLLFVTHTMLGWQLSDFLTPDIHPGNSVAMWTLVVAGDILLATAVSSPLSHLRDGLARLVKSDTRAFLVAVIFAFLSVVVITWLHVFVHILVVLSAATLVRLDTQTTKWTIKQSFWTVIIFSLTGMGVGAAAQILVEQFIQG